MRASRQKILIVTSKFVNKSLEYRFVFWYGGVLRGEVSPADTFRRSQTFIIYRLTLALTTMTYAGGLEVINVENYCLQRKDYNF